MGERTLHLVDEKQYREIYVPSVAGDEEALNQLLEWASLLAAGWEPRSQAYALVKEARAQWKGAIEGRRVGDAPPRIQDFVARVLNVSFGALSAYRRSAYLLPRGLSFSSLNSLGLSSLAAFVGDSGRLLDGVANVPAWMRDTTRALPGEGAAAGLYLPKEKAAAFLKAVRADLAGHARRLEAGGVAPEPALATLISVAIEAKETGAGILELEDALRGPKGPLFPQETLRAFDLGNLPKAVLREVRKALGSPADAPAPDAASASPPPPKADTGPPVPYAPGLSYRVGQLVEHKRFGRGEVRKVLDHTKVLVAFPSGERTLAQNAVPAPEAGPEPPAAPPSPAPAPSPSPGPLG